MANLARELDKPPTPEVCAARRVTLAPLRSLLDIVSVTKRVQMRAKTNLNEHKTPIRTIQQPKTKRHKTKSTTQYYQDNYYYCVYACIYRERQREREWLCACVCTCKYISIYVYIYTYTYIYMKREGERDYEYMYLYIYIHMDIYIYIYIY